MKERSVAEEVELGGVLGQGTGVKKRQKIRGEGKT